MTWIGLATAIVGLVNTLIQKYGSNKHLPTVMKMSKYVTQEMLAKKERARQKKLMREVGDGN